MLSKLFGKLVNNRIVDRLKKCDLFSDFQYGFEPARSAVDLLTVVSDTIDTILVFFRKLGHMEF